MTNHPGSDYALLYAHAASVIAVDTGRCAKLAQTAKGGADGGRVLGVGVEC